MTTQAFDKEGKMLITAKTLVFQDKVKKGYGAGYRIREFLNESGINYKEVADASHETAKVNFASFQKNQKAQSVASRA